MKYILITGWNNGADERTEVYDTYSEAYNEFETSLSYTTKSELKKCYWYICEVTDSYAEQVINDDGYGDDVEYVMNLYDPCFSYDNGILSKQLDKVI